LASHLPTRSSLILASSSPYRRALLERLRVQFVCVSPDIDESALPDEAPVTTSLRLASAKARAIVDRHPSALIIGSDQVAVLEGTALGKPGTHANATLQLAAMRGKAVVFQTSVCVLNAVSGAEQLVCVPTTVYFRDYSDVQIVRYLEQEQPYDCAGSAKIEGLGIALVAHMKTSDPTALIGLPLMALTTMLAREGVNVIGP
jgi:septum formation protein